MTKFKTFETAEDGETVFWRGRQWKVDSFGLCTLNDAYYIEAKRLTERGIGDRANMPDWLPHMGSKEWVDLDEFMVAFCTALVVHGHGDVFTPDEIKDGFDLARKEWVSGRVYVTIMRERNSDRAMLLSELSEEDTKIRNRMNTMTWDEQVSLAYSYVDRIGAV